MQKLEDLDFADDVSLPVLSNMVEHMQANNMRLCNIARAAGLESDQHHCKSLGPYGHLCLKSVFSLYFIRPH